MKSKLNRMVSRLNKLPARVRPAALTLAIGRVVPFVGTAGLRIEELTEERMAVSFRNRRRVQNHIGGLHAVAVALALETASGFLVGMCLPSDKVPLLKWMKVEYRKRNQGGFRAVATLTDAQRQKMQTEPKGDVLVAVECQDDSGEPPVRHEMQWAWITKPG